MKNVPTKEVIHLEFASGISATLKNKTTATTPCLSPAKAKGKK